MNKYYNRKIDKALSVWKDTAERKPLLLRGARQVGKTSAVRHLAESFDHFAEVDLNERTDLHYLFDGTRSPQEICRLLSVHLQVSVDKRKFPVKEAATCTLSGGYTKLPSMVGRRVRAMADCRLSFTGICPAHGPAGICCERQAIFPRCRTHRCPFRMP